MDHVTHDGTRDNSREAAGQDPCMMLSQIACITCSSDLIYTLVAPSAEEIFNHASGSVTVWLSSLSVDGSERGLGDTDVRRRRVSDYSLKLEHSFFGGG